MGAAGFDHEKTPIVQFSAYGGAKVPKARLTLGAIASLVAVIGAIMTAGLLVLDRFYASRESVALVGQRLDAANGDATKAIDDHEGRLRGIERTVTRTDANLEVLMRRMGAQPLPPAEIGRER